jgi:hypothetical protein
MFMNNEPHFTPLALAGRGAQVSDRALLVCPKGLPLTFAQADTVRI